MDIHGIVGSIGVYSIVLILIYVLYNVGKMTQIRSSKFLEDYDDKNVLLKNAQINILKYDKSLIEPYIVIIPFALYILVIYFISIFISLKLSNQFSLFDHKKLTDLLFLMCLLFYSVGELLFCYNENNMFRKLHRIYYKRPLFLVSFLIIIYAICEYINNTIEVEIKNKVLEILGIVTIKDVRIFNIFSIVSYLLIFILLKWITRYIVLLDKDTYIDNLKNSNNVHFSLVGITSVVLSIIMILSIAFLALNYKITYIAYGNIAIFIIMLLFSSILAGQRAEFVIITRRLELYRKKIYYRSSNGKRKLFEK